MFDSISTALEVCGRSNTFFLLLVSVNNPHKFFQIITVPSSRIQSRITKYLPNAREARQVTEAETISGTIYLLGFIEKSKFNDIKSLFRSVIGPEGNELQSEIIAKYAPPDCISIDFQHNNEIGVQVSTSNLNSDISLSELVARLSGLNVMFWFR